MKYELQPGDVGFIMWHKNPLSRVIAWFMGSKWSHCFIVADEMFGEPMLLETSDFEVVASPLSKYEVTGVSVVIYRNVHGLSDYKAMEDALHLIKTHYGWLQLLSLGIRRIAMRFGIKLPNFIRQGMVCTAVPTSVWSKQPHCPELFGVDPESIDTQELLEKITRGAWRIVMSKSETGEMVVIK